jgi:hypothetical protein
MPGEVCPLIFRSPFDAVSVTIRGYRASLSEQKIPSQSHLITHEKGHSCLRMGFGEPQVSQHYRAIEA